MPEETPIHPLPPVIAKIARVWSEDTGPVQLWLDITDRALRPALGLMRFLRTWAALNGFQTTEPEMFETDVVNIVKVGCFVENSEGKFIHHKNPDGSQAKTGYWTQDHVLIRDHEKYGLELKEIPI